jgi:hypothetical protein
MEGQKAFDPADYNEHSGQMVGASEITGELRS